MLGIGRDLDIVCVRDNHLAARIERGSAPDQHRSRAEIADLVGIEDEVSGLRRRIGCSDQDVVRADRDLPAPACQPRREIAGAGREPVGTGKIEREDRAKRQRSAVDRQRRHRCASGERQVAEEACARSYVDR